MGYRKYKNEVSADLVHKIELYDFVTGDPAMVGDRRQFFIIRGEKSREYQKVVEREAAIEKRMKGKNDENFSFQKNIKIIARRMSEIIVSSYVDAGDDEPDIIEFENIDDLSGEERDAAKARLRQLFEDVSDLAIVVNDEVTKGINFLPGRGQSLSSLLSSNSGTTQPPATTTSQE